MIATSFSFWKAFFDLSDPKHRKAQDALKIYDKERIVVNQIVISQVTDWLFMMEKKKHAMWFLDYVNNTANVLALHFTKDEYRIIAKICEEKGIRYSDACLEYLNRHLNCDVTREF